MINKELEEWTLTKIILSRNSLFKLVFATLLELFKLDSKFPPDF